MCFAGLVESGEVDPAYAFALELSDFGPARPWRHGARSFDKAEMQLRQKEWNASVDTYIAKARETGDLRSPEEISKAAKISWTGGPLYSACGEPTCGRVEEEPQQFRLCSRCKQTRYCSDACQKTSWKRLHKAVCGTFAAEPRLRSEIVYSGRMDEACKHMYKFFTNSNGPGPSALMGALKK